MTQSLSLSDAGKDGLARHSLVGAATRLFVCRDPPVCVCRDPPVCAPPPACCRESLLHKVQ